MTRPASVRSAPTVISVRTATAPVNGRASDFWCSLVEAGCAGCDNQVFPSVPNGRVAEP